ncbi:hypothetical protein BD770DRAFT_407830 [Pilaira anomala]|nr:hypothetical protein BD770DRAFT_407830 [Pilaira anomala]
MDKINSETAISSGTYSQFFPYTPEVLCQLQIQPTSTQQKVREFWHRILFSNYITVREGQLKCVQVLVNKNGNINVRKLCMFIVFLTIALFWWREYVRNKKIQDLRPRHKGRVVFAELSEEEVQARGAYHKMH